MAKLVTVELSDLDYGDYSRLVRLAELRMVGVQHEVLHIEPLHDLLIDRPGRTCFYFVLSGLWSLKILRSGLIVDSIGPGMAIGIEDGADHVWRTNGEDPGELVAGNVDRRHTIIQKLLHKVVVMPADAQPYARITALTAAAIAADLATGRPHEGVQRRLAEILQFQLLQFAQERLQRVGPIPAAIQADARLLRAWTAFLNRPDRPWTIKDLAAEAGLSRTAFIRRFQSQVGEPPMAVMRAVRLDYVAEMLRSSQATVNEIATMAGYQSDVALMRVFRKATGMTPAAWRNACHDTPDKRFDTPDH